MIQAPHFSKDQALALKGVGILLIVLHNFFHNLSPTIGENEFSFSIQSSSNFYQTLQFHPAEFFRAVFAYFGHYGVQIFVFFSAYGLTRKYIKRPLVYSEFIKRRIFKIYFSFLICLGVYIGLGLLKTYLISDSKVLYWDSLLWKALLVSNFIPGQALMPVGPWWFLPFIFQFYLIYPFFLKLFQKFGAPFLFATFVLFTCLEWFFNPVLMDYHLNLNYMVFGHASVIGLGVYLGSQENIKIPVICVVLSLLLFALASVNHFAWIISDLTFTVLILTFSLWIFKTRLQLSILIALLVFLGDLSFHLFMVNGFLRTPFHLIAEAYNLWWVDNLTALASLLFSTLFALGLSRFDKKLRVVFGL
ncbi:MAG: acyltransferase family protein [Gammaproteobacteria bacterium]|nr:acyltransferase family protein [Gammaproteobacteria bacterium]